MVKSLQDFVKARLRYTTSLDDAARFDRAGGAFVERALHVGAGDCDVMNALFALGNRASSEDIRARLADPPSDSSVRVMLARLKDAHRSGIRVVTGSICRHGPVVSIGSSGGTACAVACPPILDLNALRPMPGDKTFFDTNVLLYLLSEDAAKADRVEELLIGKSASPTSHPRIVKARETFLEFELAHRRDRVRLRARRPCHSGTGAPS